MKKEIKDLMPEWTTIKQDRNITLTNDLDSLLSCALLKHVFGYEINYFYSFSTISILNSNDTRKSIGVDLALTKGYTYCNHLTMLDSASYKNPDSANINNALNISRDNYSEKFAMSTFIMLWSLLGLEKENLSDDLKMLLLTIDSGHKGYYNHDGEYRHIFMKQLDLLGMINFTDVLEKTSNADMYSFQTNNNLDASIHMSKKGELFFVETGRSTKWDKREVDLKWLSEVVGFPVELPSEKFNTVAKLKNKEMEWHELSDKAIDSSFSYAFVYKNKIKLSKMVVEGESA